MDKIMCVFCNKEVLDMETNYHWECYYPEKENVTDYRGDVMKKEDFEILDKCKHSEKYQIIHEMDEINTFRIGYIRVNIFGKDFPLPIFDLEYLNHVHITEGISFKCELSGSTENKNPRMYSERVDWERYREIPSEIINCKNLTTLELNTWKIDKIPDVICKLNKLEILKLLCLPNIKELPECMYEMQSLKEIELHNFYLSELKINKINNLSKLSLWRGHTLTTIDIPPNLEVLLLLELYSLEFPDVSHLQKLKYLEIYDMNMDTFPESIFALNNLETLKLKRIDLDELPDEFYSTFFPRLKVLHLEKKFLNNLPEAYEKMILEKIDWGYEFRLILSHQKVTYMYPY